MAPGFIAGYYANSRLHHLSTWKAELRTLVTEAQERAERGDVHNASGSTTGVSMRHAALVMKNPLKGKEKAGSTNEQVIMHVDFDAFFVSAGLVSRPHLRGKPVVVCHSQHAQGGASSTSEIASASYEARRFGIKNGMSLQQARKLYPDVVTIPYEFDKCVLLNLVKATHSRLVHQIQGAVIGVLHHPHVLCG
jgi:DNA repair protein REV1